MALDMENTPRPTWKTRPVKERIPGRDFDIEFWQVQGDEAIFRARPGEVESPHY